MLGFCIGLKLTLQEARDLLASADMAFNPYDKRDKYIIKCLQDGNYNICNINTALDMFGQPCIGNDNDPEAEAKKAKKGRKS